MKVRLSKIADEDIFFSKNNGPKTTTEKLAFLG